MKKNLLIVMAVAISMPLAANAFYLDASDLNPILNIGQKEVKNQQTVTMPTLDVSKLQEQAAKTVTSTASSSLTELNNKMASTDKSVQKSFVDLVSILSSPKESETMQSKITSILGNSNTDSAKSMAISQLMTGYASDLVKNKSSLASTIMSMNAKDKSSLVKTISSLAASQVDYMNLAGEYTKAASDVAKTTQNLTDIANKLKTIQETANTLKTNAQAVQGLITQVSNIAKAGGLTLAE